jgi:hypothetical protein
MPGPEFPETLGLYRDCPEAKSASQRFSGGAVSIEPFQVGRSRLRRMCFAMGIQSYFCCLTASLLPGSGIVGRSSRSRWLHYAPAMKVLSIRKCLIVGTRSVRRASGLLETRIAVTSLGRDPLGEETYRKPDFTGSLREAGGIRASASVTTAPLRS